MSVTRRELLTIALSAGLAAGCRTFAERGETRRKADTTRTSVHLRGWPANSDPATVGKQVALNFAARDLTFVKNPQQRFVVYPEVCAWYGALQIAELTRNEMLQRQLIGKFDVLLTPEGAVHISQRAHVDFRVFGAVPLEIYMLTQQAPYLELGRSLAEKQWASTTSDGVTTEARYWADDLYMVPLVQLQAFRATGDPVFLDHAALLMVTYLEKLQQPNGLFLHSADSPFYWSRGNGWVAAGMTEMLTSLPANHPRRARILESYKLMMASLLPYQTPDGLWRQLIDQDDFWPETSGTGMFAFALATGVKKGWLDSELYAPAARKAWLALVANLDESANMKNVCVGTNKASAEVGEDPAVQRQYYLDRPRRVGDLHGQAPILWTAAALLRGQGERA